LKHLTCIDGKAGIELSQINHDTSPRARAVPPPRQRANFAAGQAVGMAELLEAGRGLNLGPTPKTLMNVPIHHVRARRCAAVQAQAGCASPSMTQRHPHHSAPGGPAATHNLESA